MRAALLLSLLPLVACKSVDVTYSTDYDSYHMFGDRLDAGGRARMLCWPADPEGERFRCVEDRVDRKIGEQPVLLWPADVRLIGIAGSVVVILPPDASEVLRSRAERLALDLARDAPRAGRHFVTADTSWEGVEGGRDLAARLADLHKRAARWRATESDNGFFVACDQLNDIVPDVIVVPQEGESDRQLVLRGIRRTSILSDGWTCESREFLSTDEIAKFPPRVTKEGKHEFTVFVIALPESAGPAARDRAMRIAADLLERPETAVYLRRVASPDLARGIVRPEDFQPPYVAEIAPHRTSGKP